MTTSKDYEAIITAVYRRYNPEKIKDIPFLLEEYRDRKEDLLEGIFTKYEITKTEQSRIFEELKNQNAPQQERTSRIRISETTIWILILLAVSVTAVAYLIFKTQALQ